MNKAQVALVTVLALGVGYVGGYYSHIVQFPARHQHEDLGASAATETPPPFVHPILAEVTKARELIAARKERDAQKLLREQLRIYPQAPETRTARELLGEINTRLFFSDANLYGKTEYVVERGDSLARIARKLNSTPEMIMRANSLDSTLIHPGDRLLVPDGDFTLTIDLPKQRVVVHHDDGFFKQYPIQSIDVPASSLPQFATKVTATTLWKDGERVAPGNSSLDGATPWVHLSRTGYILYGVSEESGVEPGGVQIDDAQPTAANPDTPPQGIALLRDDLAELQLLLRRGTPVTIVRERK
ncbi:MAG: LysM peptidoglycan-binding domain-containing protein [Chthoniobacteraceae bacterium]